VNLYRTALLATAASALAVSIGTGSASAAVTPTLSGGNAVTAVASEDGGSAVVTVRIACPVQSSGFSALQVSVGPQSNIDGGHSMPGTLVRCTGKTQKVAVVVTPGLAMQGYPGSLLTPGEQHTATVSLSTHSPDSQNPLSVTAFAPRTVTVKG
jgi:hypothetical protein